MPNGLIWLVIGGLFGEILVLLWLTVEQQRQITRLIDHLGEDDDEDDAEEWKPTPPTPSRFEFIN